MGVRITDLETVALYDSVTGEAFGPVFDREDEAQAFLDWLTTQLGHDARSVPARSLFAFREQFLAMSEDQ